VSAALRVSGLSKRYGELTALHEVSFQAAGGELVAILGPNGAGKTTLLSLIAGAQRPSAGSVEVAGDSVGWAPQQPALYGKLTVAENLELFARLEGVTDPTAAVGSMLEQTGLAERAGEQVAKLSGGNRQRVNVAIGLIGRPRLLALDEPTASLDPAQRERLWSFLAALRRQGCTVVLSTHDAGEAERHADRLLVLDGGSLAFEGTAAALIERSGTQGEGLEPALIAFLERAPQEQRPGWS
jgi:ABC-2 type transport system ATP-binding protein